MLQTTSLVSMLGMQTQPSSALPVQQTIPAAGASCATLQTGSDPQATGSPDQPGSLFQMILKFMQSPTQASASALQQRLAKASSGQKGASDASLMLPFPLQTSDAASAQDQSASAMMQFSPFIFTSMAQLQQALQAAVRGESMGREEDATQSQTGALGAADNSTAAGADADVKKAEAQPLSVLSGATEAAAAGVAAQPMPLQSDTASQQGALAAAADAVAAPSNLKSDDSNKISAALNDSAAAGARTASDAGTISAPALGREESAEVKFASVPALPSRDETTDELKQQYPKPAAPADAAAVDAAAALRAALPPEAQESDLSAGVEKSPAPKSADASGIQPQQRQPDLRNAADASGANASDPARTPDVFTRLHEAIAQSQEADVLKHPSVKAAPVVQQKASSSESRSAATTAAANTKQTQDAQPDAEPSAVRTPSAPLQSGLQQQTRTVVDAAASGSAQHTDSAPSVDIHAMKADGQFPQHPGLGLNDIQTRGAAATNEPATVLSARTKEDVFEKVFREVSAIRHTPASVDVTLSPESLGKVTVNVGMEEGKMSARINVQNTDVKQIIEANMSKLQDALNSSGLSLDSIAVFVNNGSAFADRRNDAPKRKQTAPGGAAESVLDALGPREQQESKQYGYNTVEYIM